MTKKIFIYGGIALLLIFLFIWATKRRGSPGNGSDEQLTADLQLIIKKIDEEA